MSQQLQQQWNAQNNNNNGNGQGENFNASKYNNM
jgi:hypothetical protein